MVTWNESAEAFYKVTSKGEKLCIIKNDSSLFPKCNEMCARNRKHAHGSPKTFIGNQLQTIVYTNWIYYE